MISVVLTQKLQQILEERDRIVIPHQPKEESCMNQVVLSHEFGGYLLVQVQVLELNVSGQEVLRWCLVQGDVEAVKAIGVWIFFSSF